MIRPNHHANPARASRLQSNALVGRVAELGSRPLDAHRMDNDLKQKFAPRRNPRYAHLRGFNEEAEWADSLDWKTNDYDFHRLFQSLLDRLDSPYREQFGLRVDQLVSRDDLLAAARSSASWYQQEETLYGIAGIYVYLHVTLDLFLGGRACEALDRRREAAEDLSHATTVAYIEIGC